MGYQPIENYGIVGDMRTSALVGMNGSVDWAPTGLLGCFLSALSATC